MAGDHRIDDFVQRLAAIPHPPGCFNPYHDAPDPYALPGAPALRRDNLTRYLRHFAQHPPRFALIGEAPGFAGARFSGVAFTSEALALGHEPGLTPPPMGLTRSSDEAALRRAIAREAFTPAKARFIVPCARENSARFVWQLFAPHGIVPLLWNALPFHPYASAHMLDNRTPTGAEFDRHQALLHAFLALFEPPLVVAVGLKAQSTLAKLGVTAHYVRHPSQGGKTLFEQQLTALLRAHGVFT